VYRAPLDAATRAETRKLFAAAAGPDIVEGRELRAWGRAVRVPESGGGAAWFEFDDLCGARHPLSAADYLEITRAFHTVFVTEVPKMNLSNKDMVRAVRRVVGDGTLIGGVGRRGGSSRSWTRATRARQGRALSTPRCC
jgi:predicted ATPase